MSKLPDILLFDQQLSEEELAIQKTAQDYCDNSLMPRIQKANREEFFDKENVRYFDKAPSDAGITPER